MFFARAKVDAGHIPKTGAYVFSADEGADVGCDGETVVSPEYELGYELAKRRARSIQSPAR